jgi:hypothetical protein
MENKRFLNVKEVSETLEISISMAYKIMYSLNKELQERGYITVAGRVSKDFLEEKVYSTRTA